MEWLTTLVRVTLPEKQEAVAELEDIFLRNRFVLY